MPNSNNGPPGPLFLSAEDFPPQDVGQPATDEAALPGTAGEEPRHRAYRELTPARARYLVAIAELTREAGLPPVTREIADRVGVTSTNAVGEQLARLARDGYLTLGHRDCARQTVLTDKARSWLAAGNGVALGMCGRTLDGDVPEMPRELVMESGSVLRWVPVRGVGERRAGV